MPFPGGSRARPHKFGCQHIYRKWEDSIDRALIMYRFDTPHAFWQGILARNSTELYSQMANQTPPIRSPECLRVLGKIVRRILLTSGLDDAIHFTPPTIAGDNHQCILKDARQTLRFQRECVAQALDSGCKSAADALKRAGASVSHDSITRYVKTAADRQVQANLTRNDVRVLAVDAIGLRKAGKSSGCKPGPRSHCGAKRATGIHLFATRKSHNSQGRPGFGVPLVMPASPVSTQTTPKPAGSLTRRVSASHFRRTLNRAE